MFNNPKSESSVALSDSMKEFYANGGVKTVAKTKKVKISLVTSKIHRSANTGNFNTNDYIPSIVIGSRGMVRN
jgi:hypothetical protein